MASQRDMSLGAESLRLFDIPLRSEFTNVLNFLILDVLFLPFIMYMSGKLAGYVNNDILQKRGSVILRGFDLPLVGGGMIMPRGWRRNMFIFLRLSVVVAVAVSNFGLEGRTSTVDTTVSGEVRAPGLLRDANNTITEVVLKQVRCNNRINEDTVIYGSVVDGKCFPNVTEFATIRSRTRFETLNASAMNCEPTYNCDNTPYPTTTFRCDQSDVVCNGVPKSAGCENQEGMKKNTFGQPECLSLSYGPRNDYAFFCIHPREGVAIPGTSGPLRNCYAYDVNRADVQGWNETFPRITFMVGKAMYASAYGAKRVVRASVPLERPVTGVRLRWVLSVAWVVAVAMTFCLWAFFYTHQGFEEIIHDERGLVALVRERMGSRDVEGAADND